MCHEAIVLRRREQQHAIRMAANMWRTDAPHALGGQLERQPFPFQDHIVIAKGLPFLEWNRQGAGDTKRMPEPIMLSTRAEMRFASASRSMTIANWAVGRRRSSDQS